MIKHSIIFIVFILITTCTQIQESHHQFATKLYSVLAQTSENILISPLSAHIALALCYQGSAGTTRQVLQEVLNLPFDSNDVATEYKKILSEFNSTDSDVALHFANNIYLKAGYELKTAFRDVTNEYFMANVEVVDFNKNTLTAQKINEWVSKKTHAKIKDIISESALNEETRIVLINAVYFKGAWAYPFKGYKTRDDEFYISDTQTVKCKMMQTTGEFYYSENNQLGAKILKMPYINNKIFFVVILPNSINDMVALEAKLVNADLNVLMKDMSLADVEVFLPKFKLETNMDLKESLQEMGLQNMFSEKANFSQMLNSHEPLTVSKVVHKTFIEINENGTEAAAATSVLVRMRRSLSLHQYNFQANRPFIFYIIDSNSILLFLGKLWSPEPVVVHDEL